MISASLVDLEPLWFCYIPMNVAPEEETYSAINGKHFVTLKYNEGFIDLQTSTQNMNIERQLAVCLQTINAWIKSNPSVESEVRIRSQ